MVWKVVLRAVLVHRYVINDLVSSVHNFMPVVVFSKHCHNFLVSFFLEIRMEMEVKFCAIVQCLKLMNQCLV